VRLNLKRLFNIEQTSVELIEIIPGFSGRSFELDCHSLHRHIYNKLAQQPSFVSTLHNLSCAAFTKTFLTMN